MVELVGWERRAEEPSTEKRRVPVAGLFHQTNRFAAGRTGLEDVEVRRGGETFHANAGAASLAGLV